MDTTNTRRIRKSSRSVYSDDYYTTTDRSGYYDDDDEEYTSSGHSTSKGRAVTKRTWTEEEDSLLHELIEQYGTEIWTVIGDGLQGRTGKQCRERYHNHLQDGIYKGDWTEEEDRIIIQQQALLGNQWSVITKMLPGRTDNAVKNRWHAANRLQNRLIRLDALPESAKAGAARGTVTVIKANMDMPPASKAFSAVAAARRHPLVPEPELMPSLNLASAGAADAEFSSLSSALLPGPFKRRKFPVKKAAVTTARHALRAPLVPVFPPRNDAEAAEALVFLASFDVPAVSSSHKVVVDSDSDCLWDIIVKGDLGPGIAKNALEVALHTGYGKENSLEYYTQSARPPRVWFTGDSYTGTKTRTHPAVARVYRCRCDDPYKDAGTQVDLLITSSRELLVKYIAARVHGSHGVYPHDRYAALVPSFTLRTLDEGETFTERLFFDWDEGEGEEGETFTERLFF